MKYFYEPHNSIKVFGQTYTCSNALYRKATLYLIRDKGICVVRKRFDQNTKSIYWDELEPGLANDIYINSGFMNYFKSHATVEDQNGFYTVNVRSIMWALRMKPLRKEWWENEL